MFDFDKKLVNGLLEKDKNSFSQLYLKTVDTFFRYLKSNYFLSDSEIEDILSTFYFKLWSNIESYREKNKFESWLWTVFKNTLIDYFKKSKEVIFSQLGGEDDSMSFEDTLMEESEIMELMERDFEFTSIKSALKKLDEKYKQVIFLKFIENKTNEEISDILDISNDTVRQRISRGLKKLRELL